MFAEPGQGPDRITVGFASMSAVPRQIAAKAAHMGGRDTADRPVTDPDQRHSMRCGTQNAIGSHHTVMCASRDSNSFRCRVVINGRRTNMNETMFVVPESSPTW